MIVKYTKTIDKQSFLAEHEITKQDISRWRQQQKSDALVIRKSYGDEERKRLIALYNTYSSVKDFVRDTGVSVNNIRKWKSKFKKQQNND